MGGCGSPESMPEQSGGVGSFLFFGGAVLVETCGVDMCIGLELENLVAGGAGGTNNSPEWLGHRELPRDV